MSVTMKISGVYFFHIPKTAGMSVWRFLEQSFPGNKICPWWLWDQLVAVRRAELNEWDVFRGHFLSHLEPYLGRRFATFTFLRDPVERTISHYQHVRRAPDHPSYERAQQMSLADFCVHPTTKHMVENYQAAYLAKSPCSPLEAAQKLTPQELARFELQERLQYPDRFVNATALFERAKEQLSRFATVGITEDFSNSLVRISRSLNCPEPQPFEAQNVSPERLSKDELDPATLSLVRNLTEVDRRLYDFTKLRYRKRQWFKMFKML